MIPSEVAEEAGGAPLESFLVIKGSSSSCHWRTEKRKREGEREKGGRLAVVVQSYAFMH